MSYILDALRRADAERQRGQVPGLGAQPAASAVDTDAPRRMPGWVIAAGILAVAAGLVALVMWRTQPAAAPAAAVPAVSAPVAPPLASPPPPLPIVVSAPPQPAQPAVAAAPLSAPAAAASRPAAAPPTPLAALSADQRRELPPLVLGGSIWSDSAAQRFVIINGQVVHEGEAAASGVVVERITPRSAILRWRELRIELPL